MDSIPDATGTSELEDMKPYKVVITQLVTREYEVDAHTPEEAEDIATTYCEDGEPGYVTDVEIEDVEAYENDEKLAE